MANKHGKKCVMCGTRADVRHTITLNLGAVLPKDNRLPHMNGEKVVRACGSCIVKVRTIVRELTTAETTSPATAIRMAATAAIS